MALEYDANVPASLKGLQEWFAGIITRPIDSNSCMEPLSPAGVPMDVEAAKYIVPSPTLAPDKRIQIYNQQYWWRLLNCLHDNFPLLTRLFGYYDFNRMIGVPFLEKHPPAHWSLNLLGDRLPHWAEEEYHYDDRPLIVESAWVDRAYNASFFAGELSLEKMVEQLSAEGGSELAGLPIFLQPHLHLFAMKHRLLPFRDALLKEEPDYWLDNDFPHLEHEKTYYFVIYRNQHYNVTWLEIDEPQYKVLERFRGGATIEEVSCWLDSSDGSVAAEASKNLHFWFQEWVVRRWIGAR